MRMICWTWHMVSQRRAPCQTRRQLLFRSLLCRHNRVTWRGPCCLAWLRTGLTCSECQSEMRHAHPALGRRSRLGCQVIAAKELDGIRVRIPGATRNFAVDGHVPKPH